MKKSLSFIPVLTFVSMLLLSGPATASGLESFLDQVDVRASKDMGSFKADLRLSFNVSDGKLDGLFKLMSKPSDVYMCLRIGEVANQPVERVVEEHQKHKGQGWGVIAKNLGIKPGSDEFHSLKDGRFTSNGGGGSASNKNKDKGKK